MSCLSADFDNPQPEWGIQKALAPGLGLSVSVTPIEMTKSSVACTYTLESAMDVPKAQQEFTLREGETTEWNFILPRIFKSFSVASISGDPVFNELEMCIEWLL